jgi:dihydrolipoamide dehydrogenase
MTKGRLFWLVLIAIAIALGIWLDLHRFISLENFKARQADIDAWVAARPVMAIAGYFCIYVLVTALNIPGATVMTLIGGALFGVLQGSIVVSFASSCGATLAFLLSRYLLRNYVEERFKGFVDRVNQGIEKDGAFYLFTLRLVPALPFFAINMVMGLTRIKTLTYYLVSQIGMFPATLVYVNAGTQLGQLESLRGILSPVLLGSFILLGLFPLLMRLMLKRYQSTALYRPFQKPKHFDTNLVVIGAGSAGLVTAYIAAAARAKVALVERDKMGGDCLNTGCVPSKALIRSSRIASYINRASEFGLNAEGAQTDFPAVMRRVEQVIETIEPHDSVERYTQMGVDCVQGTATLRSPWEVEIDHAGKKRVINTRSIVIASGGSPAVPPIPGLDQIGYLTSDNLWALKTLPPRLLVMGGGAIGCELSQAFSRLGSKVTLAEMLPRLLAAEDIPVSNEVERAFADDGIRVLTHTKVARFESNAGDKIAVCETPDGEETIAFDAVLIAAGRRGNTQGLNLEMLGIETHRNGTILVNESLQTMYPNIFACGDVAGPWQLTHAAAHQAWYAAMNALYGRWWTLRVDYTVIPRAVFCDPEVASVGINEQQAKTQGVDYELTEYGIDDLDRAIADGEAKGFVRVLTPPGSDKILGVTIVGPHAAEIMSEYALAMRNGLGLSKILGTVHIYPTLAEANKFAAGNWRKAHLSERLLRLSAWLNARSTRG